MLEIKTQLKKAFARLIDLPTVKQRTTKLEDRSIKTKLKHKQKEKKKKTLRTLCVCVCVCVCVCIIATPERMGQKKCLK